MSSVNKAIIIGRLGKDPEAKAFGNGNEIVNLTVATSESWKDKATGERKERTEWHKVTVNNTSAVNFAKSYLNKGDQVYIEGSLQTRKWTDKDGRENYTTEIVVGAFNGQLLLLSGKGEREGVVSEHNKLKADAYQKQVHQPIDLDDEIPF